MNKDVVKAEVYLPVFMLDKKEPFEIKTIGYTIFEETCRSDSFPKRIIEVGGDIGYVIEYAIWFDYDIQHLYELEHVWVYVGNDNCVRKVEGSFHGKYLNIANIDTGELMLEQGKHPVVYLQPGKHAVLADARLVKLIPDWLESCQEKAGIDGVVIQDMFASQIVADESLQEKVRSYIKKQFSFIPSMEFEAFRPSSELLCTWDELKKSIPERVKQQLINIQAH